jgi:hypothetical protein
MEYLNQHRLLYVISALVAAVSLGAAASFAWGALVTYRRPRITPSLPFSNEDFEKLEKYLIWAEEKCLNVARLEAGRNESRENVVAKWAQEADTVRELRMRVNTCSWRDPEEECYNCANPQHEGPCTRKRT